MDAERGNPASKELREVPLPGMDKGDPPKRTRTFDGDLRTLIADAVSPGLPERISRYRIEKLLGEGGFGVVYLAHDEQLHRSVAIKVPHADRVARPDDADPYLAEARTVASLEHPHIVPVYDVGSTAEFPFFVVSKYVEGTDLATKLKDSRLTWQQAAELVATVAEALHYAHKQGLVHRDVKPGNILIDSKCRPFIVDFGLALREENIGKGPRYAGTPTYMSPEQARGEGHRVDGRSDIFSLGIVFYELLVGRRPFLADTQSELLEQITIQEPRPPRQWDDTIPKELERICLKALSKRATERYTTAHDLAEDLKRFLSELPYVAIVAQREAPSSARLPTRETLVLGNTSTATPASDSRKIKIVPKGLRSFDAQDADFFLELLPGPRDRGGLPDSIRFWKSRIEQTDPDETFRVGLIYGPSGCGKSSLVKAGLLPRLAEHVLTVYVEATSDETETRMLHGLRKRCPTLQNTLDLKETLAALRRGQGIAAENKVLIILDQFEQWLHAKRDEENTALVQALRQCDGGRVQCIVMVRDDFWMAVTRFLADVEIELLQGQNLAAVDLFDPHHARRVLAAFGQAFGTLPEKGSNTTVEQQLFLDQAVFGLAEGGKVISVRLALFAEILKDKSWTPTTLKEVGGTSGVGVTFLEETFSSRTANPKHRLHQQAARAVLKSLLPESGTDIKGHMHSRQELMEASGYANRPREFAELMRILDKEVRLITPTDPESFDADASNTKVDTRQSYYHLTHDYLVPSLRDWLTRKQRESRRGRAELRLADRAAVWNANRENRLLPSLREYLNIRLLTDRKKWTPPQRKMMAKAGRVYGIRRGAKLRDQLLSVPPSQFPVLRDALLPRRNSAVEPLWNTALDPKREIQERFQAACALATYAPDDRRWNQINTFVAGHLVTLEVSAFVAWREALRPAKGQLIKALASIYRDANQSEQFRSYATHTLADYVAELPDELFDLLADAEQFQFPLLFGKLGMHKDTAVALAHAELSKRAPEEATEDQKERLAKRQANAAVALLRLGMPEKVWPLLKFSPDPRVRSYMIHWLGPLGGDRQAIVQRFDAEPDATIRRALVLTLGEFTEAQLSAAGRQPLIEKLLTVYENEPDAGLHGAAEWLLRKWEQGNRLQAVLENLRSNEQQLQARKSNDRRQWFVNPQKQTFVIMDGGELLLGAPESEPDRFPNESQHRCHIGRRFAISAHEVTKAQYRTFQVAVKGFDLANDPESAYVVRTDDSPQTKVTWYEAAHYCNWLSEQEGITSEQWCYEPNKQGVYGAGMKAKERHLDLTGYRLPTEAEWEYACRAGTVTSRYYGLGEKLLPQYAWYAASSQNRTWPVGSLKPNDLGLFDMLGNAAEWCFDRYVHYPKEADKVLEDMPTTESVDDRDRCVLRGGGFLALAGLIRSASRHRIQPAYRLAFFGFRPARTYL